MSETGGGRMPTSCFPWSHRRRMASIRPLKREDDGPPSAVASRRRRRGARPGSSGCERQAAAGHDQGDVAPGAGWPRTRARGTRMVVVPGEDGGDRGAGGQAGPAVEEEGDGGQGQGDGQPVGDAVEQRPHRPREHREQARRPTAGPAGGGRSAPRASPPPNRPTDVRPAPWRGRGPGPPPEGWTEPGRHRRTAGAGTGSGVRRGDGATCVGVPRVAGAMA